MLEPAAHQRYTFALVTAYLMVLHVGQVFIFKKHGPFSKAFFQSPDNWQPLSNKERRHHMMHLEPTHCMKAVMEYLLMDDPVAKVRISSHALLL